MSLFYREIKHMSGFMNPSGKFHRIAYVRPVPVPAITFDGFLMGASKFFFV